MKYSWFLSISVGVLLAGCGVYENGEDVAPSAKTAQRAFMPHYRKPNPGATTKSIASATATPYITVDVSNGYIVYAITDYNSKQGGWHGNPLSNVKNVTITAENKHSDLFTTTFTNPPKVKTIKLFCSTGEVQISGAGHKWVSSQNTADDDDVVWVKEK
jgi:hypothetical protein